MKSLTALTTLISFAALVSAHCCVHINVYEEETLPLLADEPVIQLTSCHISGSGICFYQQANESLTYITASIFPVIDDLSVAIEPIESVIARSFDPEHFMLWLTLNTNYDELGTLVHWNAHTIVNDTEQVTSHHNYIRIVEKPI